LLTPTSSFEAHKSLCADTVILGIVVALPVIHTIFMYKLYISSLGSQGSIFYLPKQTLLRGTTYVARSDLQITDFTWN